MAVPKAFNWHPTILLCTSGSALLNYYPAIAEAYYSEIPLIILSADRPAYKINIGDGQTINQTNVFEKNILYSNTLSQDCTHATEEIIKSNLQKIIDDKDDSLKIEKLQKSIQKNNEEIIEIAFNLSINKMQPVHLNVPMEEPLYEFNDSPSISVKVKKKTEKKPSLTDLDNFYKAINKASKIMILIGVSDRNILSKKSIQKINSCPSIIVMKEHTSNVFNESFISNIDRLIGPIELQSNSDSVFDELSPEIVISLGGMIVSKKIKSFLRNYKPRKHFHIGNNISKDSFYSGVEHINTTANKFFENIVKNNPEVDKLILFRKSQKFLDRILFILFAEDKNLIPTNAIPRIVESWALADDLHYKPLYELFKTFFIHLNVGHVYKSGYEIPAYGGGLFMPDDVLDNLKVDDEISRQSSTVDQLLQGRAAGIQVTQNAANPNSGISVRIRGTNSLVLNDERGEGGW